jgi:drug/metabolite transporter (DMT)-like permease
MILSGVCFVAMHSAAKYLADEVHIFEIVFLRCALVVVILSPFLFKEGGKSLFTKQPKNQIYRIVTNSIAILLFFYGLSISPLSLATVLNFTAPIFTVIFAVIFLKEKLTTHRLISLLLGFIGVMCVLRPDLSSNLGGFLVLLSSLVWASSLIFIKKLTKTDSAVTISLYAGVGMMPATFAAAYPYLEEINFVQFLFILFIAVSGTTAQTLLNSALKRGELSFLLPLDFLRLIWSVLLGIALFGESTSVFLWLGGLFILGATTLIVTSERKNQLL